MGTETENKQDERQRAERRHGEALAEADQQPDSSLQQMPVQLKLLLSNRNMGRRGNEAAHVATMRQAQQTMGNRAVQRAIQRSAAKQPVAVQRDDDDDYKPHFTPFLPELGLPFGGGFGMKSDTGGVELGYSGPGGSGKLGYNWGGGFSAEGGLKNPFGTGADLGGKLEFDPFKLEGSATGTYGQGWLKGAVGGGGFGIGGGYGAPLIAPPGSGLPPGIGDPTKDLQQGGTGPSIIPGIGGATGDIKDQQEKNPSGFGLGGQFGYDPKLGWYGWGGIQGSF